MKRRDDDGLVGGAREQERSGEMRKDEKSLDEVGVDRGGRDELPGLSDTSTSVNKEEQEGNREERRADLSIPEANGLVPAAGENEASGATFAGRRRVPKSQAGHWPRVTLEDSERLARLQQTGTV